MAIIDGIMKALNTRKSNKDEYDKLKKAKEDIERKMAWIMAKDEENENNINSFLSSWMLMPWYEDKMNIRTKWVTLAPNDKWVTVYTTDEWQAIHPFAIADWQAYFMWHDWNYISVATSKIADANKAELKKAEAESKKAHDNILLSKPAEILEKVGEGFAKVGNLFSLKSNKWRLIARPTDETYYWAPILERWDKWYVIDDTPRIYEGNPALRRTKFIPYN